MKPPNEPIKPTQEVPKRIEKCLQNELDKLDMQNE